MKKIITYILLFFGYLSSKLSIKARTRYGRFIGFFLRIISSKREQITYTNLLNAFPEKNIDDINDILKKSYQNLGIVLIEMLTLKFITDIEMKRYVKYENIDLIKEVHKRGKGIILLSAHYGNWEFLAYAAGLFTGIPILAIVKSQQNDISDSILNQSRVRSGNTVVPMHKAARPILKTLNEGNAIAIIVDQSARPERDVFVDFFGRPAVTFEAPAALALKYGVPIVYGFGNRHNDGTYSVKLEELRFDDLNNNKEGIRILTERHVKILENVIRKKPELWAWQHRRWKHKPLVK